VVVLCLGPELDPRYERVYAYLQDDVTRHRPGVHLALDLLGSDVAARAAGKAALAPSGPLRTAGIVHVLEDANGSRPSPLLALDDRVGALLLGDDRLPDRAWLRLVDTPADDQVPAPDQATAEVTAVVAAARQIMGSDRPEARLVVSLYGNDEAEARAVAERVAAAVDLPLLVLDVRLAEAALGSVRAAAQEAARESLLQPAVLLMLRVDGGEHDAVELRVREIADVLDRVGWLTLVATRHPITAPLGSRRPWLGLEVPSADLSARAHRWRHALATAGATVTEDQASSLASRYRLGPGDITTTVAAAASAARVRSAPLALADVEAAARAAAGPALSGLARRVFSRLRWADLVLPAAQKQQLAEVAAAVQSRRRVLSDWGFAAGTSRGRGLSALFSGAPGTGKTMAAEIIAGQLGLDLYAVDLATVVSKYIGETEKNLSRIFDAAESTSGLLFFDEADALFGKRSEVKDAHDRYANIEISYLLQRIETHDGLVVLATNLERNLDEAFLRRLAFVVKFPFPDAAQRRRIWRATIPSAAPLARGIEWDLLARFPIAGGSIRNAVLHAAYQCAAAGRSIRTVDLLTGVRRELEKLGRVPSAGDFGRHWAAVAGSP
jgi:hypothetical protein